VIYEGIGLKKKKGKAKYAGFSKETRNNAMLVGNPIWRALAKNSPVPADSQISIGLASRKALYALTNDDGDFEHLKELMISAYAGIYLAEQGYGVELKEDFNAALHDLHVCFTRVRDGQNYFLDPLEAQRVSELLGLHEQQLELADRALLAQAILQSYRQTTEALTRLMAAAR